MFKPGKTNLTIALFIAFLCVMILVTMTGCGSQRTPEISSEMKITIIKEMASVCLDRYAEGTLAAGTKVSAEQIKAWCDNDSELYKAIVEYREVQDYYALILDDDTVMIHTESLFQSVYGYVVTDQELNVPQVIDVPTYLYYDGNSILVDSIGEDGIYKYSAGV